MKVLFVMHYPGYLRYYDGTVRELAERGHHVSVAFDVTEKQEEGGRALEAIGENVEVIGTWPKRRDRWTLTARMVRGLADYCRYLHPDLADSRYLRGRMEKVIPPFLGFLTRIPSLPPPLLAIILRFLLLLECAIPSSQKLEQFLRANRFDLVFVSPLVTKLSAQTDLVKSARSIGIPVVLGVASWDHLTTKGLIRAHPDRVLVWNDTQRREAIDLHLVRPESVEVTGAQPFDRWFTRGPSTTRERFLEKAGLPPGRPFVLFVGSTASISSPDSELRFVRRWIGALRSGSHPALGDLAVLVRPHPYNPGLWPSADLTDLGGVAVWPRAGANPVDEADRDDYFDSLHHCAAVVGINTSAMIEAAIQGRPVLTVQDAEFSDTQGGTVHFRYLLPEHGGFVSAAKSLSEHARQLAETLADPRTAAERTRRFVESFVRPCGLDRAATPLVVDAIERVGQSGWTTPDRPGVVVRALRFALAAPLFATELRASFSTRRALKRARRLPRRLGRRAASIVRSKSADESRIEPSLAAPQRQNGTVHGVTDAAPPHEGLAQPAPARVRR